jgi:hypothetical protein
VRQRYPHDISRVLVLRLAGWRVKEGEPRLSPRRSWPFLLLIAVPMAVCLAQLIRGDVASDKSGEYLFWNCYFFAMAIIVALVCRLCVAIFYHATRYFSDVLTSAGVSGYHAWADSSLKVAPQVFAGLLMSVMGCGVLWQLSLLDPDNGVFLNGGSYLMVFATAFVVGDGAYWIAQGTVLTYRWHRQNAFRLWEYLPGETPGIVALARVYSLTFLAGSALTAMFMFPVIYYAQRITIAADHPFDSFVRGVFLFLPALVSCGSVVVIGVLPQIWLSRRIEEQRADALRQFEQQIRQRFGGETPANPIDLQALEAVLESPRSSLRASGSVSFGGAGLAAAAPYVAEALLKAF